MNRFSVIFIGFLLAFFASWTGLVIMPVITVGDFQSSVDPEKGEEIPPALSEFEQRGKDVYIANGCVYCHSQQLRPARAGTDIVRGWGPRRTIAPDYMSDGVTLLGTMRTGPDLAAIGIRNPSAVWNLIHLYNPQITSPGSNMPPFPFLFETRKIGDEKSPDALALADPYSPPDGYEVVPTEDANALVAYLQSLKFGSYSVPGADRAAIESQLDPIHE